MNTEEARVKTSGLPARDRGLPRRSVEILRDLGLSTEKIGAYHRRFPTPTANHVRKAVDKGHRIRHDGVAASWRARARRPLLA